MGHALMENRHGLVVDATLTRATGTAERDAALLMLERRARRHRITPGADEAYDVEAFVGALRARRVSPHIAVNGGGVEDRQDAQDRSRWPHHATRGLRDRPTLPQADRRGLQLDRGGGRIEEGQAQGTGQCRSAIHLCDGCLHPRAVTQALGSATGLTGRPTPRGSAAVAHAGAHEPDKLLPTIKFSRTHNHDVFSGRKVI